MPINARSTMTGMGFLILCACQTSQSKMDGIGPLDLNADAATYDGQSVTATGYFSFDAKHGEASLYQSRKDYDRNEEIDVCVSLRLSPTDMLRAASFDQEHVIVDGAFRADAIEGINLNVCNVSGIEVVDIKPAQ